MTVCDKCDAKFPKLELRTLRLVVEGPKPYAPWARVEFELCHACRKKFLAAIDSYVPESQHIECLAHA